MSYMCSLQSLLHSPNGLDVLKNEFGITVNVHPEHPNLHQFTYDQILSAPHKSHPVVRASRGTILDASRNWSVVAHPFLRFFNSSEGCADPIDWETAKVEEKVDGSLCIVYQYDGRWRVATKGSPNAGGNVGNFNMTFAELFWKTAREQGVDSWIHNHTADVTFLFELTSPFNEVVVPHKTSRLTFLACFSNIDGAEFTDLIRATMPNDWCVKRYSFTSIEQVEEFASKLHGLEAEGFVVVDGRGNRIKVKGESYLAYAHMRSSFSPKNVLDAIRKGEVDEVYRMVEGSELKTAVVKDVESKYNELVVTLRTVYEANKEIPVQKDFALAIQRSGVKIPGAMYAMRNGQARSVQEYLFKVSLDSLASALNLKENKHGTPEGL